MGTAANIVPEGRDLVVVDAIGAKAIRSVVRLRAISSLRAVALACGSSPTSRRHPAGDRRPCARQFGLECHAGEQLRYEP